MVSLYGLEGFGFRLVESLGEFRRLVSGLGLRTLVNRDLHAKPYRAT